jgi:AhpC/TSA family
MRFLLLAGLLALGACGRESAIQPSAPSVKPAVPPANAPVLTASDVEGWQTNPVAYARLGSTAPNFKVKKLGGGDVTQDSLRGRWTILAFWGLWSDDSLADAKYIHALNSAADQDPDLDFLSVHIPPGPGRAAESFGSFKSIEAWFATQQGASWPTLIDADGKMAEAFRIEEAPVYLLVGPDLTIEGFRGELSETPDDGIKSVIRGVAQIKKQIADPT